MDTNIINRVLRTISTDELNQLTKAIADAVEYPDDRSYCQIIKHGDKDTPKVFSQICRADVRELIHFQDYLSALR